MISFSSLPIRLVIKHSLIILKHTISLIVFKPIGKIRTDLEPDKPLIRSIKMFLKKFCMSIKPLKSGQIHHIDPFPLTPIISQKGALSYISLTFAIYRNV